MRGELQLHFDCRQRLGGGDLTLGEMIGSERSLRGRTATGRVSHMAIGWLFSFLIDWSSYFKTFAACCNFIFYLYRGELVLRGLSELCSGLDSWIASQASGSSILDRRPAAADRLEVDAFGVGGERPHALIVASPSSTSALAVLLA